jgi:hypothetical protein
MTAGNPEFDPLRAQIEALVQRAGRRELDAYARLVKLGLTHCQPLTKASVDQFTAQLKGARLPASRVSEIKAILCVEPVARRFTSSPLGIRKALKLPRSAKPSREGGRVAARTRARVI